MRLCKRRNPQAARILNPDWLQPDWPAPPWIGAVCTTRAGGVSKTPFDKLNLGDHVGDAEGDVFANRANFSRQLKAKPVFLNQVHGFHVASINPGTLNGQMADASITREPGLACTIMVADCLPVLFTNRLGTVVAAAHAGWRGLAGSAGSAPGSGAHGVLEACFQAFKVLALGNHQQPSLKEIARETLVWLGPCIGAQAFEVGDEVRDAFVANAPAAAEMFYAKSDQKWLADLQSLARQRLQNLGITEIYGNDGSAPWCTVGNPSQFFSHRRDHVSLGGCGRMAAAIWLE